MAKEEVKEEDVDFFAVSEMPGDYILIYLLLGA